jgi:hydrogenase maturation factor
VSVLALTSEAFAYLDYLKETDFKGDWVMAISDMLGVDEDEARELLAMWEGDDE